MSASSDERLAILGKLQTKQIQCFLRVLSESSMPERRFIEPNYAESARNFEETLEFLKSLNWVREEKSGALLLTKNGEGAALDADNDDECRVRLIEAVIAQESPYVELLVDYLSQFQGLDSSLVHRPSIPDRLHESRLRNFLVDVGVVAYRSLDDSYVLTETGIEVYVRAKTMRLSVSRKTFETSSERKLELGNRAELVAFEYEKRRVGEAWEHKVDHVSLKSPYACYDIQSVTLIEGQAIPRYIEVKAEPREVHQFFWTAAELELASLLQTRYFLYLLPVAEGDAFDLARMTIIQDPFTEIYHNSENWVVEENVIVCRQRR